MNVSRSLFELANAKGCRTVRAADREAGPGSKRGIGVGPVPVTRPPASSGRPLRRSGWTRLAREAARGGADKKPGPRGSGPGHRIVRPGNVSLTCTNLVGDTGIEPVTSTVSR
jgi:hypothetical protein